MGRLKRIVAWAGILALLLAVALPAARPAAQSLGPETNLPLPRYVSLRSAEVNVRRGPGLDYRIDWVFRRAGLPVRIVAEYRDWRKIADSENAGGWVYHALLTRYRTALVTEPLVTLREKPTSDAAATARAERGVVAALRQCEADWCELQVEGTRGWVRKAAIWGVEPDEVFGR
ncbi:MAG TPA: SH3 domain-containing protein [Thermohalobaculum sp.]|nr:SH3 domain-containing protein [Thermohalobaculum sp.]